MGFSTVNAPPKYGLVHNRCTMSSLMLATS
nr:MAG TPA: hypothetical protein [Caudoviricetes sp.]